jgi:hypothetical protein
MSLLSLLFGCSKDSDPKTTPKPKPPVVTDEDDGDPDLGDISAPGIFYDKFSGPLDVSTWESVDQLWGQSAIVAYQHGGVISENVSTNYGFLILRSLGDAYQGSLRGANGAAHRLGAVIKSKDRFASGRFEVKMKVLQAPDVGVLSAAWLFWYKDISKNVDLAAYEKAKAAGNIPNSDSTIVLNHEVDIEVKGVKLGNTIYTNWIGIKNGEYESKESDITKELNDNAFHVYRWDWHTGGNGEIARVEYYIDNDLMRTNFSKVPYIASYFYVGNWFAWWAGNDTGTYKAPAFDTKEMLVDWVKITPFYEPNDDWYE